MSDDSTFDLGKFAKDMIDGVADSVEKLVDQAVPDAPVDIEVVRNQAGLGSTYAKDVFEPLALDSKFDGASDDLQKFDGIAAEVDADAYQPRWKIDFPSRYVDDSDDQVKLDGLKLDGLKDDGLIDDRYTPEGWKLEGLKDDGLDEVQWKLDGLKDDGLLTEHSVDDPAVELASVAVTPSPAGPIPMPYPNVTEAEAPPESSADTAPSVPEHLADPTDIEVVELPQAVFEPVEVDFDPVDHEAVDAVWSGIITDDSADDSSADDQTAEWGE